LEAILVNGGTIWLIAVILKRRFANLSC